jgi:hypothetical protein
LTFYALQRVKCRSQPPWRRPQLGAILQAKRDRGLNDHIIDSFERLWRQPIEATVERVMFGHRIAVEIDCDAIWCVV